MIMYQGGAVDVVLAMPTITTNSTGEVEYCNAALAAMAAAFTRKMYNKVTNRPADQLLTIPLGLDSKAAMDIAASSRETKRTRHIQRRYHYLRECVNAGGI